MAGARRLLLLLIVSAYCVLALVLPVLAAFWVSPWFIAVLLVTLPQTAFLVRFLCGVLSDKR